MSPYFIRLINHTEFVFWRKCTKFPLSDRCRVIENTVCTV